MMPTFTSASNLMAAGIGQDAGLQTHVKDLRLPPPAGNPPQEEFHPPRPHSRNAPFQKTGPPQYGANQGPPSSHMPPRFSGHPPPVSSHSSQAPPHDAVSHHSSDDGWGQEELSSSPRSSTSNGSSFRLVFTNCREMCSGLFCFVMKSISDT